MGHMAGPLIKNGANHWASSSDWALGPNWIRPEHRLLEDASDKMRSYPLTLNLNLNRASRKMRIR